jgi:hypothetical protein
MNMPNLNVIVQDARFALTPLGRDYQVIGIDAYRPPYIPWQLTTTEFFTEVRTHLAEDGVVIINVGRTQTDRRLVEAVTATLLQVFPTVHTMDVPESFNTMLVATNQPTNDESLAANAALLGENIHPFLKYSLGLAQRSLRPTVASDLVFTDDHHLSKQDTANQPKKVERLMSVEVYASIILWWTHINAEYLRRQHSGVAVPFSCYSEFSNSGL